MSAHVVATRCNWEDSLGRRCLLHVQHSGACETISGKDVKHDAVNHPKHYVSHPSGVECITVVEHMGFNLGNAIKYIWRADEKGNALEDLEKARWYVEREIAKRKAKP